ncbi:MAG: DUF1573 domain-containing protein [Candidatus Omnitrophica bacterium]|nr:DUF1573 domain-containing protein [Candidatus Omnitrophota bacterium]
MFRITLLSAFLLLTFAQTGCYSQGTAVYNNETDKRLDVDNRQEAGDIYSYDFGQVKEGEVLKHNFILKNESQNLLTIKDLNTSCGCTGSKAEKRSLLPGETTSIEVQFNTKGYSGQIQQYVYVQTDNIDNPVLKYIIKAEVIK